MIEPKPSEPTESAVRSSGLLAESVEYMKTLNEVGRVQSIGEMLTATSYVFLTRPARVRLAWDILKTIFR
jgi:hypothetical protein